MKYRVLATAFLAGILAAALLAGTTDGPDSKYVAYGDSGGPLFWRGRLAGVNCLTMADKGPLMSRVGEESGHVRVSAYRAWIEDVIYRKPLDP